MSSLVSRILRLVLKLLLGLFAAIFAVSLLTAALIVLALSLLKSLLTGQKPAPARVFGRFQRFSSQAMWSGTGTRDTAAPRGAEIVDVEVREIRDGKRLP